VAHDSGFIGVKRNKDEVLEHLHRIGVVSVVRCQSSERLKELVASLYGGGIRAIEITLTTPGAVELLQDVAAEYDSHDLLVGAGTVVDVGQAAAVIDAGARYVVSPTIDLDVIAFCVRKQVAVIPGAFTPTEIQAASRAGADVVKVFPANIGGPNYLRDLAGPLPHVRLMPTGGVDLDSAPQYFAAGAFAIGVGGAVFGGNLIRDGKFDEIRSNAERFVSSISSARQMLSQAPA
jgi:2-dehydro-3-deoxyphosphogluconate aldolase/(4S)-4-hydroxy-2-oxoglutarate aldolase